MTFSYEVLRLPWCIDDWHYIQYLTKRSHSICAAEQHVKCNIGSSHEHKFSSDIQQLIKGGQTFGGGSTLIGLRSDIELSRGEKEKAFDRSHFNPCTKVNILICGCCFH